MRKSDKKIDRLLCKYLTQVCEKAKDNISGFIWLTHTVNYSCFPQSLYILCVFDTNSALKQYRESKHSSMLEQLIYTALNNVDVKITQNKSMVGFDTQENCDLEHDGNWNRRLNN